MDSDLGRQKAMKRRILLENYQHPVNRGLAEDPSYLTQHVRETADADSLTVQMRIGDGRIAEIRFDGEACALCLASASLMAGTLTGKTPEEAERILAGFGRMLEGERGDPALLGKAAALDDACRLPGRKLCVGLPWRCAGMILEQCVMAPEREKQKQTDRKTV